MTVAKRWMTAAGLTVCLSLRAGADAAAEIHGAAARQSRAEIVWTRAICKEPGRYIGWPSVCLRKDGELLKIRLAVCPDVG